MSSFELGLVHGVDHVGEVLVLLVRFDAGVVNVGDLAQVVDLGLAVEVRDRAPLLRAKREQFRLLCGRETLEVGDTRLHLILQKWEKGVVLVLHKTRGDASECRLEGILLNLLLGAGVPDGGLDLLEGADGDLSEVRAEIRGLIVLYHLEHVADPPVEVLLHVQLLIRQVVYQGPLLHIVILAVYANVLHLFFGVAEVSELLLLGDVGPLAAQLLGLVARVDVVEDCELGPDEVGEVADLDVAQVECNEEFVMEDHATNPFVVGPAAEPRDGVDGADVEEDEEEAAARSAQRLVVRGDLLRAHRLKQSLHVVKVREYHRVLVAVIRMHIALSHRLQVLLVVAVTVFTRVCGFDHLLGLRLNVFHLCLICGLELGLDVEGDRAELAGVSQRRLDAIAQER